MVFSFRKVVRRFRFFLIICLFCLVLNYINKLCPTPSNLFLFCYERDFIVSLSHEKQVNIIESFNSTPLYLDDLLSIDNEYFEQMVETIYPKEVQLNKIYTLTPKHRFWV